MAADSGAHGIVLSDPIMKLLPAPRRPDLMTCLLFKSQVFLQFLLDQFLKIQHTALPLGVQRPVHIDVRVQVLLDAIAQVVILQLDALKEIRGPLEDINGRLWVAEGLVLRDDCGGTGRDDTHDEEVRGREVHGGVGEVVGESSVAKKLDVFLLDVVPVGWEMLKAALVGCHGVPVEVGDFCDSWMARLTMVALADG